MSTLQDVKDYFKDDKLPDIHPFQDVPKTNTYNDKYNDAKSDGGQYGYSNDGSVNNPNSGKNTKNKK